MTRLTTIVLVAGLALTVGIEAKAQPKEPPGYWQYVEMVRIEYPVEKVHKFYPVAFDFEGSKLKAVAKALDGNDPKVVLTEEHQVWSWTPPPQILVPGEKLPMKFELKLDRPKFANPPGVYIGGRINAGFLPPKPKDAAVYHMGADTRTEKGESGGLDPRDKFQGGLNFAPATYTRDSFVVVPGRNNPWMVKAHPDQISFRVGGVVGNTREFNTIYEYKWVEGVAPADRGGPAGERPKDMPAGVAGKWQYRVVDLSLDQALGEKLEKQLTDLGNEGWELAGVITTPTSVRLVLKRTKK